MPGRHGSGDAASSLHPHPHTTHTTHRQDAHTCLLACLPRCPAGRDPLIDVALALEAAARSDDYFVKRKLYPNVDFFSGEAAAPHGAPRCTLPHPTPIAAL